MLMRDANGNEIPENVVTAIREAFPLEFPSIMERIRYNALDDYWGFSLHGIWVGVERDGYIHS